MKLVTVNEAARALSVSRTTVQRLISKGKIQSLKVGRAVRIPEESLQEYMGRNLKENYKNFQATKDASEYIFEVVIEPDEDRYHAYCSSLKGCRTWGHTEEEAYKNIKEALELYLEALIDEGDPIPGIGVVKNIQDIKPIVKVKEKAFV